MKFDHIWINPPYCRNLHLKILNEAIRHSDDIVNLSPNFYENYKKFKNWMQVGHVLIFDEFHKSFDSNLRYHLSD